MQDGFNTTFWQHYEGSNELYVALYDELWDRAESYAFDTLKGDELAYFVKRID